MKKGLYRIALLTLAALMLLSLAACAKKVDKTGVWENATYLSDQTFGEGTKTITLKVTAEDQTVTFTVKTDAENLADALTAHGLIAGEDSVWGLMVDTVNGMKAVYAEGYWWALYEGDEAAAVGPGSLLIKDGGEYTYSRVSSDTLVG